jgi:hypothetical protein
MSIFVSIASYRDPLLKFTLLEAYNNAANKHNLFFGVVEQQTKDLALDLDSIPFKNQIRYVRIEPEQSRGCCWARNIIQSLYCDETYFLQIDSHTAFDESWDTKLIASLENILSVYPKAIITGYPDQLHFDDNGNAIKNHPTLNPESCKTIEPPRSGSVFLSHTRHIRAVECMIATDNDAIHGFMLAAGGLFTLGKIIQEIPYDPYLLFDGEEPSLALRAWTHGWNIFHIKQLPFFHLYTPHQKVARKLFWDESEDTNRNFGWNTINVRAIFRLDKILTGQIAGPYGLGNKRTLEDYKMWSGIDYPNKKYTQTHIWKFDWKVSPEELLSNPRALANSGNQIT